MNDIIQKARFPKVKLYIVPHFGKPLLKTFGKGDYYEDFDKIMFRMHANCPDGIFERFQIALHDVNRGDMQAFHAFHRLYLNGYGAADLYAF